MNKVLTSISIVLIALCVHSSSALASHQSSHSRTGQTLITFRIHVPAAPSADTTFWVAYGPVDGHFGLIRLHAVSAHLYQGQQSLASDGRTTFAFLSGHGTISTGFGSEPGAPVQTIQRVGPVSLLHLRLPTAEWHASTG